jgi:hypothetical protein
MNKIAILQSNYIPWRGYFDIIKQVDTFVIYDEVQYTKNDWRNRNKIKTLSGLKWMTIPVKQKTLDQKIFETEVVDQNWRRKHLNSIKLNYAKAPFFNEYISQIESLFNGNEKLLSDINLKFIKGICEMLNIKTEIIDSKELNLSGDKNQRLIEACYKLNATHYLSGKAAQSYIDLMFFEENNITVEWMDYSHYQEYPQLFPPFEMGVSVIDSILNIGNKNIFL